MKGFVNEPNKFHNYETEKIFHPRLSCTTHLMLFSERPPIYASSCLTISGGRTEQHVVIGFGELVAVD